MWLYFDINFLFGGGGGVTKQQELNHIKLLSDLLTIFMIKYNNYLSK